MKNHIRRQDGISILEPSGKIMGPSVSKLRNALLSQIEAYDAPHILINFEQVNMIDSSGLGALMETRAIAKQKRGRVGVIHVGKQIKNLIVLSRLASVFERYDSEDAAVEALAVIGSKVREHVKS